MTEEIKRGIPILNCIRFWEAMLFHDRALLSISTATLMEATLTHLKSLDAETLQAAGKRLRSIVEDSYDDATFRTDLGLFVDSAEKGVLLPDMVVKKVGDVFINPKFNPEYAQAHEYRASSGYPEDVDICVCGLRQDDIIHLTEKKEVKDDA